MAAGTVRSRSGGVTLGVELEGFDRTAREFRAVRQRVKRELVEVERAAAEQEVLPDAKQRAARHKVAGENLGAHLVVRKRSAGPYLTTNLRGIRARAAGLIEFGGTVRTPIVPKHAKALLVNGSPRAIVRKARHYRAHHYLQDAANAQLEGFGMHVRDAIVDFFTDPFETH